MPLFHDRALEEHHILITGASGGIGAETAKVAIQTGSKVTITGRNEEKLQELTDSLKGKGSINYVAGDLIDQEDRERIVEKASELHGPITGLVNSAGIAFGATLEELQEDDIRKVMELNYTATVLFTQLVYRQMLQQEKGAIVNVSSLSGLRGTHGNIAYSASKFAVIGFTQSLAIEAIEHNIRVNAVCPGFVDTEMAQNILKKKAEKQGRSFEEQMEWAKGTIPSGRLTSPEEVANSIIYLLTDAAENIVGESMKISGGNVMR
ncbi:SDR family NAD(P)-dependent oxidoreductase [Thalassobacillus hwangdonensis]|uniref:SDR family NAD(P)-dependent oxidoreductase n=1 Tax=Thalassobacillus hwangdonensis TaxID=546108 RepID=A0ABW3L619_9BACI